MMILTDEQVEEVVNKITFVVWESKIEKLCRAIERAVLEQVAQMMLKDNDEFDPTTWAMCERDWAERLRQMAKGGQG